VEIRRKLRNIRHPKEQINLCRVSARCNQNRFKAHHEEQLSLSVTHFFMLGQLLYSSEMGLKYNKEVNGL
jgi:hypothetical protein